MTDLREKIIIALEDELCSTEATFGGVADRIIAMLQEQEPVAYRLDYAPENSIGKDRFFGADDKERMERHSKSAVKVTPLYATPKQGESA